MTRRLSSLHARVICHATEDCAKVELAMRTVVGDVVVDRSSTEGHFGNPIVVLESTVEEEDRIMGLLTRMTGEDMSKLSATLKDRIDDACQLFLRFDKQEAYQGRLRLADGDDVVAVRTKVRAFPAKPRVAVEVVSEVLAELRSAQGERAGAT